MKTFQLDIDIQHNNNRILKDSSNIVSQITDKVQNIAFTQSTSTYRPIYNYNGYYSFDGANDYIENDDTDFTLAQQEFTIVIKSTLNATSGKQRIIGQWDSFKFAEWFFDYNSGYRFVISKTGSYANSFQLNWNSGAPLSTSINVINCQVVGQTVTLSLISAAEDGTYTRLREKITTTLSQLFPSPTGTKSPFVLGRLRDSAGVWTYGNVDLEYVRIYDKALFDMTNVNNNDILGDNTWLNMFDQPFTWYKRYEEDEHIEDAIINGNFANSDNWNLGSTWSINNSAAHFDGLGASNGLYQNMTLTAGESYTLKFEITSDTSMTGRIGTSHEYISGLDKEYAKGIHELPFNISTNATNFQMYPYYASDAFSISNIQLEIFVPSTKKVYISSQYLKDIIMGTDSSIVKRINSSIGTGYTHNAHDNFGPYITTNNGLDFGKNRTASSYNNKYLWVNNVDLPYNDSDFYIGIWVKRHENGRYRVVLQSPNASISVATTGFVFWTGPTNFNNFLFSVSDGTTMETIDGIPDAFQIWKYYSFIRSGDTIYVFVDGRLFTTHDLPAGFMIQPATNMTLANYGGANTWGLEGAIDDILVAIDDTIITNLWQYNIGETAFDVPERAGLDSEIVQHHKVQYPKVQYPMEFTIRLYTDGEVFTVPHLPAYNYDYDIDYGDGNVATVSSYDDANTVHTYALAGYYTISITGICDTIYFTDTDRQKLISVESLGSINFKRLYFYQCDHMQSFDCGVHYNLTELTSVDDMFFGCGALSTMSFPYIPTGVTSIDRMFNGCHSMTSIDVSNWNLSNIVSLTSTFDTCNALTSLNVNNWDVSNVELFDSTFARCYSITTFNASNWNTSSATSLSNIFYYCSGLHSLDLSNWNVSSVESLYQSMAKCATLTSVDTTGWNTSSVTDMGSCFSECTALTALDTSSWNTSSVTDMRSCFSECTALTTLDTSSWNTLSVTDMSLCFSGCTALTTLDTSSWNMSSATNVAAMFYGCSNITNPASDWWLLATIQLYVSCYTDNVSRSNYTSIPSLWGGGGA